DAAPGNIGALEENKRAQEEAIEVLSGQIAELEEQNVIAQQEYEVVIANIDRHKKGLTTSKQRHEEMQKSQMHRAMAIKVQLASDLKYWNEKALAISSEINEMKRKVQSSEENLNVEIERANQICERVEVKRSKESLEKEIKLIDGKIRAIERQHGNKDQVTKELLAKISEHRAHVSMIEIQRGDLTQLESGLSMRRQQWDLFRRYITARAKIIFSDLISKRLGRGNLEFNHQEHTLNLSISGNNKKITKDERDRDTKSLSGGEKSYSQVCLLISLWDTMGGPFRALDEWDIFCDSVNRTKIMRLFLDQAESDIKTRQYILITPQDLSVMKKEDRMKAKLIRLADPARNGSQNTISQYLHPK
ncbi:Structural maintenance of chromosomes protein 6, partial [Nowakowskiella sp. JEL0078]